MARKRAIATVVGACVLVLAGIGGLGAGVALGALPALLAPAGLTADSDVSTEPMPAPNHDTNAPGLTYGSAAISDHRIMSPT
ncbi:MAG: hypothetical protein QM622_00425 [Microbacterium sp.]